MPAYDVPDPRAIAEIAGLRKPMNSQIAKLSSLRTEDIRNARPTRPRMLSRSWNSPNEHSPRELDELGGNARTDEMDDVANADRITEET